MIIKRRRIKPVKFIAFVSRLTNGTDGRRGGGEWENAHILWKHIFGGLDFVELGNREK